MKQESVLQVLSYLFENYLQNDFKFTFESEALFAELEEMGFDRSIISHAFDWLEGLIEKQKINLCKTPSPHSFRVFTPLEQIKLNKKCQGFIYYMERSGLLNPANRELIIDRAIELGRDRVSLHQIKWITLLVLFNQTGAEAAVTCMEQFVLNEAFGVGH